MTDQPLATRDLAGDTDAKASDAVASTERPRSDQGRSSDPTNDRESAAETEPTAESPTPDRSESELQDAPLSEEQGEVTAKDELGPGSLDQSQARPSVGSPSLQERGPLLPEDQSERFSLRWQEIQTGFVDQPRDSVVQADALVADLMQRLAASFSNERERLESQWDRGDDVSTEDLRVALTRYRSFFDRLLSA
jgi:hypothetical protein